MQACGAVGALLLAVVCRTCARSATWNCSCSASSLLCACYGAQLGLWLTGKNKNVLKPNRLVVVEVEVVVV